MGVFIGIIGPVTLVSELKALGGHIVAHDVSACFLGAQTFFVSQNLCPQQMLRAQTGKHLCWQQCVLVWQGL